MDVFQAVTDGDLQTLEIYLKAGGHTDMVDDDNDSLLDNAVEYNNLEVLLLLLSYNTSINTIIESDEGVDIFPTLSQAVAKGNGNVINSLLIHGANPNERNFLGRTSLHKAAVMNKAKAIELLLLYSANPNAKDNSGETPLEIALRLSHSECVNVLLNAERTERSSIGPSDSAESNDRENLSCVCKHRKRKIIIDGDEKYFHEKKTKLDVEINELKTDRTNLLLSFEESKGQKALKELNHIKLTTAKNYEKLKRLQETIVENCSRVSELTKTIINHDNIIMQLKKSRETVSETSDDDNDFECPICLQVPLPPLLVYQCNEGHIYCSKCRENPNMYKCSQCRQPIKNLNIRCRMMEKMIEKKYSK